MVYSQNNTRHGQCIQWPPAEAPKERRKLENSLSGSIKLRLHFSISRVHSRQWAEENLGVIDLVTCGGAARVLVDIDLDIFCRV